MATMNVTFTVTGEETREESAERFTNLIIKQFELTEKEARSYLVDFDRQMGSGIKRMASYSDLQIINFVKRNRDYKLWLSCAMLRLSWAIMLRLSCQ